MKLTGTNLIGYDTSAQGTSVYRAQDPTAGNEVEPAFHEATQTELDRAMSLASHAFDAYRAVGPDRRATFLRLIADNIEALDEALVERAVVETALGAGRIRNERGRTTGQLRMFADLVDEGSWVEARIDNGNPERTPAPKPDLRRMLLPLGPVVVFGASNFPLAFSVAGGDTASALAAGCPVVVKAHPAHPGTSELVGRAIVDAAKDSGMPDGVFSLVHGAGHETGLSLVRHWATEAVAFTGSLQGGRALYDAAAARAEPIPVYAEMASVNPVFVLPKAAAVRGDEIARGLQQSFTLGAGQFCTKPGIVVASREAAAGIGGHLQSLEWDNAPMTMLHEGIAQAFRSGVERLQSVDGVLPLTPAPETDSLGRTQALPVVMQAKASTFLERKELAEEVFGPATVLVTCDSPNEALQIARGLEGHLTATIHGEEDELLEYSDLVKALELKVGRLLFNGYPTGVEVGHAVQHGGPYPSTTDSRSTSVGTAAIYRFARPVCYQDFPQSALPEELKDGNPRNLWRLVDGELGKD